MDGIIFDVDGTLWDSTDIVAVSWNNAINENSDLTCNITGSDLKKLFGKTMDEILLALFPDLPKEEQTRLGELCFEYENNLLAEKPGTLYPNVEKVFKKLSEKTELYIVSNCQCGYIEVFLETTGLQKYIKDHLCFGQTNAPKHETIRQLMKKHDLTDVIYVGDTQGDFDACKNADIPFIFAEYGFGDAPEADSRITALIDLPYILDIDQ